MTDWHVGYAVGLIIGAWMSLGKDLFDVMMFTGLILSFFLIYLIWISTEEKK